MILSEKDIIRFWAKVQVCGPDECWPWLAGTTKFGHGVFSIKHKWILAHRVSFLIGNGYLPSKNNGRMVMHDCERASCQNPKHLIDGTSQQNQKYENCIRKHKSRAPPMLGRRGKLSPRFGMKHSDETKTRLSKIATERGGWNRCNEMRRERKKLVPRHENLLIFRKPETA